MYSSIQVKKCLKRHFKLHTGGLLQFSNCCYGFWYAKSTNCYYYLDPYQCDERGRKTTYNGNACLCIFSSMYQMAKHMCLNQHPDTTGFFLHRIHVDSVDTLPSDKLQEDPMWVYLDYHWNFGHSIVKRRKKKLPLLIDRPFWNNYVTEVAGLIYSLWGTIGAYDYRFGGEMGKNRTAICVAALAMQNLCHPSRWSAAMLDSAVICGNAYYTDSLKRIRDCSEPANRFQLHKILRLFPHVWTVNFGTSVCGVLYGDQDRMTLTDTLKMAFEDARDIIVECNDITVAVSVANNSYYVIDPCWIGPPLFIRNRGAIYALCCRNMNILVYAITKMINSNQRLGVRVTPVIFIFGREDFRDESEICPPSGRILLKSLRKDPGRADEPAAIPGAGTVPNASSHPKYLQYLARAARRIDRGQVEERKLPLRYEEPPLSPENVNNTLVSTKWRLNLGQARPPRRFRLPLNLLQLECDPAEFIDCTTDLFKPHYSRISIRDMVTTCDYPSPIDFTSDIPAPDMDSIDCASERSEFLRKQSRMEFEKRVKEYEKDPSLPRSPPPSLYSIMVPKVSGQDPSDADLTEATTEPTESEI